MYLHNGKNEKDTIRIANGYSQILGLRDYNIAIKYSDSIISITSKKNHFIYPGYAYMSKGITYYKLGRYGKSLENYLIANDYAIKNDNKQHQFYINAGIAEIKILFGDYDEAVVIFNNFKIWVISVWHKHLSW